MKRIYFTLMFLGFMGITFSQEARNTFKCPPVSSPLIGYTWQNQLKSGVSAEWNFWFARPNCDCSKPFGVLCYFSGLSTGFKVQYFPANKFLDFSGNLGYRNANMLPLGKLQMEAGYSHGSGKTDLNFFHVDPSIGFDLLMANVSIGYSFRSEKLNNKIGSPVAHVGLSPLLFFKRSKPRTMFYQRSKISKADRSKFYNSL